MGTRLVAAVLVLAAHSCPWRHRPLALSAEHRFYLERETFSPARRIRELPRSVQDALRALFKDPALAIADAPQAVATSGGSRARVPSRRLIAAGCSPHHCLVHYEHAGRTRTFNVILFGLINNTARLEWGGVSSRPMRELPDLKSLALRATVDGGLPEW
jgi:hypothetical protein